MIEKKEVTWFPSYGAEIRGGTANCTVILSDSMIGSPVVLNPDILVIMNKASMEKFESRLKTGGLLFYDSSLISKPELRSTIVAYDVPATRIAGSMGNTKSANMVMLGALIARTNLVKQQSLIRVFADDSGFLGRAGSQININSIMEGMKYIENTKSSHQRP